jgi:hypothetical protein
MRDFKRNIALHKREGKWGWTFDANT